jgi:archaellum component FlaG (FlaF/FlaG flagellin family)
MITNKLLRRMTGLTLAVLLLTGCGEAPAEPTLEATPILPTATSTPAMATAVPKATAEASSDLQPLSSAECSDLADAISQTLGIPGETANAPFQDHVSQRMGTGCQTTITGTGLDFESVKVVQNALRGMIAVQGWYEDFRYGGGGPTGELTGFRQANRLCRLLVGWEPSEDANCPSDQPIYECELSPEQKLYTVSLNCVQDTTAAITQLDLEPARIQFAPGAVSAQVESSLTVGGVDRYVLTATAGQEMTLNFSLTSAVDSAEMSIVLTVWGADGSLLSSGYVDTTGWMVELPSTQDYYIDVMSVAQASVDYTLEVIIPSAVSQPEPEPTRIQFAPGAISAQVQGSLAAGGVDRYVLTATAGQEMTVNLSDSSAVVSAILVIWGADGTVLISDHADATIWVGEIPFTQDYYIAVRSVIQASVDYTLQVMIP